MFICDHEENAQEKVSIDVSMMRGAYCNTEHRMLTVKVVERDARRWDHWDVTKLKGRCFDETGREASMGSFVSVVEE